MLNIIKNEKFSIIFITSMILAGIISFTVDLLLKNELYWFQRSGALLVLAGVELQYSRLTMLWQSAVNREKEIEPVQSRIDSGKGIGMKELTEESEKTRAFALIIFDTVTKKAQKKLLLYP